MAPNLRDFCDMEEEEHGFWIPSNGTITSTTLDDYSTNSSDPNYILQVITGHNINE